MKTWILFVIGLPFIVVGAVLAFIVASMRTGVVLANNFIR